ncbi:DUF6745 domain-containing protein [Microcoleus sp. PH2017_20_SFW_D_A]|uniref:DUF6745 domain-containing protein n=1 Tax=unclassified Microcoleus TaxID=2642155 RepID=UPI00344FE4CA
MSQTKVKKLTPAQEALIRVYRDKWKAIALSTGPIDRSQAAETITLAYRAIGKPAPEIIFCDRPYQAANIIASHADKPRSHLRSQLESKLRSELEKQLLTCLRGQLENQLKRQLQNQLENELYTQLQSQLWSPLRDHLAMEIASKLPIDLRGQRARYLHYTHLNKQLDNCIQPELWASGGSLLDFCISVLNCAHSYGNIWTIFQSLVKTCGWIFPYDKVCVVCEKPIALSADNNHRLHAGSSTRRTICRRFCDLRLSRRDFTRMVRQAATARVAV